MVFTGFHLHYHFLPKCLRFIERWWTPFEQKLKAAGMAAIGSLIFCTDCGNLLDSSSGNDKAILRCDVCGIENKGDIH